MGNTSSHRSDDAKKGGNEGKKIQKTNSTTEADPWWTGKVGSLRGVSMPLPSEIFRGTAFWGENFEKEQWKVWEEREGMIGGCRGLVGFWGTRRCLNR